MKHNVKSGSNGVLCSLSSLPRKILALHGKENLTEFVLHDLAGEGCFNFQKAAYFVDNPDFDCIKGVAGFNKQDIKELSFNIWDEADSFSERMRQSLFNTQVRAIQRPSFRRMGSSDEIIAKELASGIGMPNYQYCSWDSKHRNHGILLYEPADENHHQEHSKPYVQDGACLLGLCPVF